MTDVILSLKFDVATFKIGLKFVQKVLWEQK